MFFKGIDLGRWGEDQAANYLVACGYTIIERNFRTPYGEIDLVAGKHEVIVFVEVKTRRSARFGLPEEALTARKRAHCLSAAQFYIQEHPGLDNEWRVDVIAIRLLPGKEQPEISHFENAFSSTN